jgi:hypothetical protein
MAKKYKFVEVNGKRCIETSGDGDDAKPLIVDSESPDSEEPVDAIGLLAKVLPQLREEAKQHRLEAKKFKDMLSPFVVGEKDGDIQLFNLEDAKAALEVSKKVKQGELIQAGERDKVIASMVDEFKSKEAALVRGYDEQIQAARADAATWRQRHDDSKLDSFFAKSCASGFLSKTNLSPDLAKLKFGGGFKFKDDTGDVYAVNNGEPVYSKEKAGDLAGFEEAIQTMYGKWPEASRYLKGSADAGGGARQPGATVPPNASTHERYKAAIPKL